MPVTNMKKKKHKILKDKNRGKRIQQHTNTFKVKHRNPKKKTKTNYNTGKIIPENKLEQ